MASWSGLWNNEYGENYSVITRTGNRHTALARVFAQRVYSAGSLGAILKSLVNGNLGDNATLTHKRRLAVLDRNDNLQGGKVDIEVFTDINRATTAADQTALSNAITLSPQPTYPTDKSGNGGGSKRDF